MSEKIYRVQMNSKGMPNFSTAVEVADRPQGEWICKGDWAECSLCGADSGTIMNGLERVPRYTRFCPECGAKMKGADNE